MSVYGDQHRRGEEGGGLAEDSSSSVYCGGWWPGGGRLRGDWRVSHLCGSLVSCNHKDGEDASVGGVHGVGEEADVGGGAQ